MQPQPDVLGRGRRGLQVGDLDQAAPRGSRRGPRRAPCEAAQLGRRARVRRLVAERRRGNHTSRTVPEESRVARPKPQAVAGGVESRDAVRREDGYWPVRPSMHSRSRSAWPQCRAYSSIRWTTTSRISRSPSSCCRGVHRVARLELLGRRRPRPATPSRPPPRPRLGDSTVEVGVAVVVLDPHLGSSRWRSITRRHHEYSTAARCRSRPSSDIVDGGTDRRASCSASRPSHWRSKVARKWSRYSLKDGFLAAVHVVAHAHTRSGLCVAAQTDWVRCAARAVRWGAQASEPSSAVSLRKNSSSSRGTQ